MYLRPYDLEDYELGPWSNNAWDNEVKGSIKLAIMDFRNVPGEINKETAPREAPHTSDRSWICSRRWRTLRSRIPWYGFGSLGMTSLMITEG